MYPERGQRGYPSARISAASTSFGEVLYIYGGHGLDRERSSETLFLFYSMILTFTVGVLDDLWSYSRGEWIFLAGTGISDQLPNYPNPGGREAASIVVDRGGMLWLFGGSTGTIIQYYSILISIQWKER